MTAVIMEVDEFSEYTMLIALWSAGAGACLGAVLFMIIFILIAMVG